MSKWIFAIVAFFIFLMAQPYGCTVVDSGEVGIKFHKWNSDDTKQGGVEGTCNGWVIYNAYTTDVFTYPTYTQRKNYDAFTVNTKDAAIFTMDPLLAYHIDKSKACDIFAKYRKDVEDLEDGYIKTCIYEAYRICANNYTSDSLMSNRANFETDVRARLEQSLGAEGFIVDEFTSQITPPRSLTEMIESKTRAVQAALKAENEVKQAEAESKIKIAKAKGDAEATKIKADAEAYYNRTISASLSPLIIKEDLLEKWDGHLPMVASGNGMMLDIGSIMK